MEKVEFWNFLVGSNPILYGIEVDPIQEVAKKRKESGWAMQLGWLAS